MQTHTTLKKIFLLAALALVAVSAVSTASAASTRSHRATAVVRWHGGAYTSAPALRRAVARKGLRWERFLHAHPAIVRKLGMKPVRWDGGRIYSRSGMKTWLRAHHRTWHRWAAKNRSAARRLRANDRARVATRTLSYTITRKRDREAPSQVTGLTATNVASPLSVALAWAPATDNVRVYGYYVYKNGVSIGRFTTTALSDTSVTAGSTYSYKVRAYDTSGNLGAYSDTVSITVPSATVTPTPTPTPPPPPPSTSTRPLAVSAPGNIQNLSSADLTRQLDLYKSMNVKWMRMDINWAVIQYNGASSFNWAPFDAVVSGASARGIQVLAVLQYTPGWARAAGTDSNYPPSDLSTYARFASQAVAHYAPMGIHTWEIWNEPNIGFWKPSPDPARYTELLKLAYASIKQADPTATVVSAGLSPYGSYGNASATEMNPLTFLERMYAAGAKGSFDVLGWHPYNFPGGLTYAGWSAWSQMAATPVSARSLMVANGDGSKKIWATEFGAPTGTSSQAISEATQATLVTDSYAAWRGFDWSGILFWYSGRDNCTDLANRECNFGIVHNDWSAKPAFTAFAALVP